MLTNERKRAQHNANDGVRSPLGLGVGIAIADAQDTENHRHGSKKDPDEWDEREKATVIAGQGLGVPVGNQGRQAAVVGLSIFSADRAPARPALRILFFLTLITVGAPAPWLFQPRRAAARTGLGNSLVSCGRLTCRRRQPLATLFTALCVCWVGGIASWAAHYRFSPPKSAPAAR